MNSVNVVTDEKLSSDEEAVLHQFKRFQQAMIEKDQDELNELILEDYTLTHMSGKTQTKEEFIEEIMDGTLNYYKSTVINPKISVNGTHAQLIADVTLDAKVYGIKGVWTLHTIADFQLVEGEWLFAKWDK